MNNNTSGPDYKPGDDTAPVWDQTTPPRIPCCGCGAMIPADQNICPLCGAQQKSTQGQQQQSAPAPDMGPQLVYKKSGGEDQSKKTPTVPIAIGVAVVAVIAAAAILIPKLSSKDAAPAADTASAPAAQEQTVNAIEEQDADITTDGSNLSFEGTVKVSTDSRLFLSWDQPISIQLKTSEDQYQLMKDISSVYLQNSGVDSSLWSTLPIKQTVKATGSLSFSGGELTLSVDKLTNTDGSAIVQAAQEAETDDTPVYDGSVSATTSDEILPQSDDRLLTNSDVTGLSLREINYAKNEIYARHGRKFSSPELQRHFDSCSWYNGTISPSSFSESSLSSIEQKNAAFLAKIEFSMDPKGYKLDA